MFNDRDQSSSLSKLMQIPEYHKLNFLLLTFFLKTLPLTIL